VVEVIQLEKSYGKLPVLRGVDARFEPGKITALVGPNAAGKTTLIKSVLGLVLPDGGEVRVNGKPVAGAWAYRREVGYMPQSPHFPVNLTVSETFALARSVRAVTSRAREEELTEVFGLAPFLASPVRTLSGGTRQKVSAVVALMFDPSVLVLDEPTAGLDPLYSSRLKDHLAELRTKGVTILLTSHYVSEVEALADEVVFLLEGRVKFAGALDELRRVTMQTDLERSVARLMEGQA
jgi:Cu-processing system ATP-binding protein